MNKSLLENYKDMDISLSELRSKAIFYLIECLYRKKVVIGPYGDEFTSPIKVFGDCAIATWLKKDNIISGINSLDLVWNEKCGKLYVSGFSDLLSSIMLEIDNDYVVNLLSEDSHCIKFDINNLVNSELSFKVNIVIENYNFSCCRLKTSVAEYKNACIPFMSYDDLARERINRISSDTTVIDIKDLLDLYELCISIKYGVSVFKNISVENFKIFKECKETLRRNYELYSVDNSIEKPSFDMVYDVLSRFLEPLLLGKSFGFDYIFAGMWRAW